MTQAMAVIAEMQDAVSVLSRRQKRLYKKIPTDIYFVPHRSFSSDSIEEELFGSNAKIIRIPDWTWFPEIEDGDGGSIRHRTKSLTKEEEATLFLRYNYARYRLSRLVKCQKRRFSFFRAKQMLLWYDRMQILRAEIVQVNLGLVIISVERFKIPCAEFTELVSEGNIALLRAVDKFDVSRGFKFSTYACRVMLSYFYNLAVKIRLYHQRHEFNSDCDGDGNGDWLEGVKLGETIDMVRYVLKRNTGGLSKIEARIINERFGITSRREGKMLRQVAEIVGLTTERVRQVQNQALGKIRRAIEGGPLIKIKRG